MGPSHATEEHYVDYIEEVEDLANDQGRFNVEAPQTVCMVLESQQTVRRRSAISRMR